MSYFNVWAEVVFGGFPKKEMFTQILLCLFSACHQTLSLHQVSCVGVLRLVRFASSTGRRRRRRRWTIWKMDISNFTPFLWSKWIHFLTKRRFWPHGCNDLTKWPNECVLKVKIAIFECTHLMLDNQCHPYIPSTTVLGDIKPGLGGECRAKAE